MLAGLLPVAQDIDTRLPLIVDRALAYVELWRGTPVLLQLYLLYYGLAPFIHLGALSAAVLGLGMNYGAYEAEVHRAALQSLPVGQTEAAAALLRFALRFVHAPSARARARALYAGTMLKSLMASASKSGRSCSLRPRKTVDQRKVETQRLV